MMSTQILFDFASYAFSYAKELFEIAFVESAKIPSFVKSFFEDAPPSPAPRPLPRRVSSAPAFDMHSHFARIARKGRPEGGYVQRAPESLRPRRTLMQMMRETGQPATSTRLQRRAPTVEESNRST